MISACFNNCLSPLPPPTCPPSGGVDYGPFPTNQIQLIADIPANVSETTFSMNIRDDSIVENSETFRAVLRLFDEGFNPFGRGGDESFLTDSLSEATVVIEDDDCEYNKLPLVSKFEIQHCSISPEVQLWPW